MLLIAQRLQLAKTCVKNNEMLLIKDYNSMER